MARVDEGVTRHERMQQNAKIGRQPASWRACGLAAFSFEGFQSALGRDLAPGSFELLLEITDRDALEKNLRPALLRPLICSERIWIARQQRVLIVLRELQDRNALFRPEHSIDVLADTKARVSPMILFFGLWQ